MEVPGKYKYIYIYIFILRELDSCFRGGCVLLFSRPVSEFIADVSVGIHWYPHIAPHPQAQPGKDFLRPKALLYDLF